VNGTAIAREKLKSLPWNNETRWVVKADGLALGKGVVVAETREEAISSLDSLSQYGEQFLIEERIAGEECSWFAFSDGETFSLLDPAKDYKRLGDGNSGPNTGGMGAVSPAPGMSVEFRERIRTEVFEKVFGELMKRGIPYRGLLYAGLMVETKASTSGSESIIRVLEFNARFGDPETQALLPRMKADLLEWMGSVARGTLRDLPRDVPFSSDTAVYVVAAAEGYPDAPKKSATKISTKRIEGDSLRFAGLSRQGDTWSVTGGRVLGALGMGKDTNTARNTAYAKLEEVLFPGAQIRKDIGL
jgi:phosphoribosylamine--glycine ligase